MVLVSWCLEVYRKLEIARVSGMGTVLGDYAGWRIDEIEVQHATMGTLRNHAGAHTKGIGTYAAVQDQAVYSGKYK